VNVLGSSVSSETLYIEWSDPPFGDRNGLINSYIVNVTELFTGAITTHTVMVTSITLLSLHPFYQYEVRVAAVTVSSGPFSPPITVQTDSDGENYVVFVS